MPDENDSRDVALDQAAQQLSDGIRNCRKVVESYRTVLLEGAEPAAEPAASLAEQLPPESGTVPAKS